MPLATPTQAIEMLLRALYEGTASDGPWVAHNGVAWEMAELACQEGVDGPLAYQTVLVTLADDRTKALTRQAAQAVRSAADRLLVLLDGCER
ncbi:MAG TPA: hypothetical protein ENI37_09195 [Chloroflexi bacterium]|nr:hypothetical protein [Chloroflexota bacterium]